MELYIIKFSAIIDFIFNQYGPRILIEANNDCYSPFNKKAIFNKKNGSSQSSYKPKCIRPSTPVKDQSFQHGYLSLINTISRQGYKCFFLYKKHLDGPHNERSRSLYDTENGFLLRYIVKSMALLPHSIFHSISAQK